MNLIVKLIISIAVAAAATALTIVFAGEGHAAPVLFIAFCGATIVTALLVSLPGRAAQPAVSKDTRQAAPARRQAKAKTTASANASDGPREHGTVKWFNVSKGFGFITKDNGVEIFVHFRSIRGGGRRGLRDGQAVSFVVAQSDKGPQAEDVESID